MVMIWKWLVRRKQKKEKEEKSDGVHVEETNPWGGYDGGAPASILEKNKGKKRFFLVEAIFLEPMFTLKKYQKS